MSKPLLWCCSAAPQNVGSPWDHRRCKNRVELFGCVAELGRGAVTPAVCLHIALLAPILRSHELIAVQDELQSIGWLAAAVVVRQPSIVAVTIWASEYM